MTELDYFDHNKNEEKSENLFIDERKKIKYSEEINKLRRINAPLQTLLDIIDAISRDYFKKRFNIERDAEYSDLIEFFSTKNNPAATSYCQRIMEYLYSGDPLTKEKMNDLIGDLEFIMDKEDPTKEEEIEKKGPLASILEKIKFFENETEKKKKDVYLEDETKKFINQKLNEKEEGKDPKVELREKIIKNGNSQKDLIRIEGEEKKIENIDNLERIKSKIRERKDFTERTIV
jgi:hypothetical protein